MFDAIFHGQELSRWAYFLLNASHCTFTSLLMQEHSIAWMPGQRSSAKMFWGSILVATPLHNLNTHKFEIIQIKYTAPLIFTAYQVEQHAAASFDDSHKIVKLFAKTTVKSKLIDTLLSSWRIEPWVHKKRKPNNCIGKFVTNIFQRL